MYKFWEKCAHTLLSEQQDKGCSILLSGFTCKKFRDPDQPAGAGVSRVGGGINPIAGLVRRRQALLRSNDPLWALSTIKHH